MEIIQQLGINGTVLIQFGIFICVFLFLNLYLFKPYYKAIEERENRTLGGEDLAVELHKKSKDLYADYQDKAKDLNQKIKDIYDVQRADAAKDSQVILDKAKTDAATLVESTNQKIAQSIQSTRAALQSEATTVSVAITQKLLGK